MSNQPVNINPYRLTERILLGLLGAAALTAFCVIITAAEWWPGVGLCVGVVVAVVLLFSGVDEWNQRKKQWDFAHAVATANADDTVSFHPEPPR